MMIRVLLLCIPLLLIGRVSASGDSVSQILNTTFERKVGDTVTLPCLVQMNITHERVEWFKGPKTSENDQPIHKCIWRPKATQTQRYDFKNLTSLFEEELSSGNFSLSLTLNTSHNGTYYCYVGGRLYCIVTIKVLPKGKNNTCPDPDNPNMVQRPNTTIKGKDGDTVILPCSTKNRMNLSHDRVEWFKGPTKENKPIHKYIWRGHAIQIQRDDFKDRTSLFEEELSSGNCSLRLQVNTSHSGLYYCCVPGLLYCPVNLDGT
ncbi:uncharacterized protein LOC115589329 [Sparus aurata]|uniref:uncharacterized protein LOC115589329 n=1 Tax=Sparus aurata TaxID=8175 RepID=UPI0011C18E46|nr:uncharacterized protein LOC115589329 [Sparus aurata]